MNLLSGLWMKISALFAFIAGLFFIVIRYQSGKIDDLEHDNKVINAKSKIQSGDALFKADMASKEQGEILKGVKSAKTKSKFDSLNDF